MTYFLLILHSAVLIMALWILFNKKTLLEKNLSWSTAIRLAPFGLIAIVLLLINDILKM